MKELFKFKNFGTVLSREDQKHIVGGEINPSKAIICICTDSNGFQHSACYNETCNNPVLWCATNYPCPPGQTESAQCEANC